MHLREVSRIWVIKCICPMTFLGLIPKIPFPFVLVHSWYYNKNAMNLMVHKQQTFISHSCGGWEVQHMACVDLVFGVW